MNPTLPRLRLLLGSLLLAAWLGAGPVDGRLEFQWVDVEGGAATLIYTPAGESILLDSGNPGGRDPSRILAAARAAGLERIDHLVTSHFHTDHFGGAAELAELIPIVNIHDNGIPEGHPDGRANDPRWPLLIKPYAEIPARRHVVRPGYQIPLRQSPDGPRLRLTCLAARQEFIPPPADAPPNPLAAGLRTKEIPRSDNDNSNVFLLEFGQFRYLNAGDLTWNLEARLVVPVNRVGEVDVYQTSHHGRDDSNNTVFIHSLAPTVAIMNNGILKGAMPEAVAGLRTSPGLQAVYQVHKNLRPGEEENNTIDAHIANFDDDPNGCAAHRILLSVAPDGASYTVSLPTNGHSRTFTTRAK